MVTRRIAVWLGLLLLGCEGAALPFVADADGYEFRLQTEPELVLRWPSGSTVRVFVAGGPGARAPELRTAFRAAADAWNRPPVLGEYRLVETTDLGAADVVLRWSGEASPVALEQCAPLGVRAVTTFCAAGADPADGLQVFPRADGGPSRVRMVVTIMAAQAPAGAQLERFVLHEFGHVLGIGRHSPWPDDLMYGGELQVSALSARDIATVRLLYRTRAQVRW